ncbi:MAG: hypothetical protein AB7J28_02135 [Hyphomonadaceae bacterium]
MQPAQLFRLAAIAAILAGALRIAAAFPLPLTHVQAEALYTAIDILLLFGLIGIYLDRARALGFLGLASFGVGAAALSFIGGPDADPFGFSTYEEGAITLAIAMGAFSIAWISRGQKPILAPLLWFASLIAGGVLGYLPAPLPNYGVPLAGALFGGGFLCAGLALLRREPLH